MQENQKHLVNFTTPTKRKLRQNQNTRTLLRKFTKNSEESPGVVVGGQLESPAKRRKCTRDGESFNPIWHQISSVGLTIWFLNCIKCSKFLLISMHFNSKWTRTLYSNRVRNNYFAKAINHPKVWKVFSSLSVKWTDYTTNFLTSNHTMKETTIISANYTITK